MHLCSSILHSHSRLFPVWIRKALRRIKTRTGSAARPKPLESRGAVLVLDREQVRAAVLAHDGLGPSSELTGILMRRFAGDANEAARWAVGAAPRDYGELAPLVFTEAARGDRVAAAIIANAVHAIAALISALHKAGAQRIALLGGVGAAIRPLLPRDIAALLREPLYDATDGAILLAGGILPASVAENAAS